MANNLNNFEQAIKDSFSDYEVAYDPMHWEELEEEMALISPTLSSYFGAITTGIAATGIVFMSMLFFFAENGHTTKIAKAKSEASVATPANGNAEDGTVKYTSDLEKDSNSDAFADEMVEPEVEGKINAQDAQLAANESNPSTKTAQKKSTKNNKSKAPVTGSAIIEAESKNESRMMTGCTGLIIDFEASKDYGKDAKYLWNFGDGFFSNEANPSHTFNKEGIFDVSLSVTSPSTGQISSNVVQAMIEVVEAPLADFAVSIDHPGSLTLENKSLHAVDAEWMVDGKSITNKALINLSIADNTRINISINAANGGGCADSLAREIEIVEGGSKFPTALDLNAKQIFNPATLINSGQAKDLKIFADGSQVPVYESMAAIGWTGLNAAGAPYNKGSYTWLMTVENDDAIKVYRGKLELR